MTMAPHAKQRTIFATLALLAVLAAGAITTRYFASSPPPADPDEVVRSVTEGIRACQAAERTLSCYRALATRLFGEYALPDIFSAVETAERDPDVLEGCHSLMHFTGQAAYLASRNVSQSLGNGNPVCFAGYYHGVLEEYLTERRADAEDPKTRAEIPGLCEPVREQSQKRYNECLHGLGHALMFLTDTDLPESLRLCDLLPSAGEQNWCYSGVFMENSTSATNREHPSPYLKPEDPLYPCTILDERYLTMCYTLQSFYFAELEKYDWERTAAWCMKVPDAYRPGCFHAIGQTQVGFTQDEKLMVTNCSLMPTDDGRTMCIRGAAGSLFERYNDGLGRMLALCAVTNGEDANACYRTFVDTMRMTGISADERATLCARVPEDLRAKCAAGTEN
jgi:hypothetical protein